MAVLLNWNSWLGLSIVGTVLLSHLEMLKHRLLGPLLRNPDSVVRQGAWKFAFLASLSWCWHCSLPSTAYFRKEKNSVWDIILIYKSGHLLLKTVFEGGSQRSQLKNKFQRGKKIELVLPKCNWFFNIKISCLSSPVYNVF